MFQLDGQIAVITGGASGIGAGIVRRFAKRGARVVLADVDRQGGQRVVQKLSKDDGVAGEGFFILTDVSNKDSVDKMVKQVLDRYSRIDILVNNAGIYLDGAVHEMTEKELDKVLAVDLRGVWNCSRAVLESMLKRGSGRIINISSIAGLQGFPSSAAYCAAKAGVANLTKEMALDYGPKGITINAIAPGVIDTPMSRQVLKTQEAKEQMLQTIPVGRLGQPEDVAAAALFLASKEADFINGEVIVVDGGQTAG